MIGLLIGVHSMAVDRRRLFVGTIPEDLLLLGELLADAVDATDAGERQIAVGRVGEPRRVGRV